MGKRNFFRSVCSVLACGHMPFPMIWGRGAMITLDDDDDEKAFIPMIEECEYLFPNIRINHVTILRHEKAPDPSEFLTQWMDRWNVGIRRTERRPAEEISRISREENIGLVIIRPFEKSFFKSFTRAETISLAHQLPCPLFIARHSYPYERILVPFNATPMSERALETAIELAGIFGAELDAAVVQPPDFIHDEGPEFNPEHLFRKVRNFSHLYKIQIGEIVLQGNPVRELTALAADYQLMIVGSTSKDKEFLTPHVGELLTERTPCSVLIIARD